MDTERNQRNDSPEELDPRDQQMLRDSRRFSLISAGFAVLTLFMAFMSLVYGWNVLYVLAPAIPCLLFNGGARALRQRLQSHKENRGVFRDLQEDSKEDK